MAIQQRGTQHSLQSTNLADLLERVLDKGIVIAGDIKIHLVDVELLTIQIRLVICSVDKAKEMGMDWWVNNPALSSRAKNQQALPEAMDRIEERLARIETSLIAGTRYPLSESQGKRKASEVL
jgi:hypothetical protein